MQHFYYLPERRKVCCSRRQKMQMATQ